MRESKAPVPVIFVLLALVLASDAGAAATAFVNVNVVSMTSATIAGEQTVIIDDGRIVTIGAVRSTPIPQQAVIVDGTDRYLMPGLAEMHGHVPGASSESLERTLALYVVNGVTTVRGMLGQRSHLQLRDDIAQGKILGPKLVTSGPSLNGSSVSGTADAVAMVEAQYAAGYDFLKIHPGLTREEYDAMAAAANRLGMKFAGHVPEDVGVDQALATGMASIDHLDGYMVTLMRANEDASGGFGGLFGVFIADQADAAKIPAIAAATARARVWNVPTESLFEHIASPELDPDDMVAWPEMRYMPLATVEQWRDSKIELLSDANYKPATALRAIQLRRELILALHRAGAGLLLGSDSPQIFNVPGFAIHRELRFLVQAGLTPYEALRTGTVNAARYFSLEDQTGTVETGRIADLVLLDANPLDDVGNSSRIHGVMVKGRWLAKQDIERILDGLDR
jgi:imidazolonepropionase-like amidohydrolase